MAIVTTLTFDSTAYDVSDYVIRHSIEIDEQLFNPDNLKPTTNRCDFKLSRSCPYIDELFAWTGDVEVSVVADGVAAFTGYLTDNYGLKITARGASDVSLSAEDPGIKKLKTAWVSTGALVTIFAGEKVCDPADTSNSFLHILAGLAGVTLATTLPTISDTVYFSVQDKDKKQYWDILEKVLLDYRHVFYFDASGKLALFALDGLTGTASQYVCTNGTILQKSPGDPGIEIKKRLIQYKEVIVNFDEGETLAGATAFRDTTGQGLTDCEIEIAAGAYYPTSCDASTYAYVDYFLEDGREIKAVDSITADFSLDSGITYEMTNLGTSAQIRFHNPTGLARSIRKLKITGTNVLAIKADSKVTSTIAGGKKLEYDAAYITELADAQSLANLLRYYYANSGSLYTFRAYAGTLYPSDTLFPSDTLYPLGDIILLGDITRLHDPVWTGLDVNCGIYRKKYTVGKAGATFDAVGIGTINLADAVSLYPIVKTPIVPVYSNYPSQKALTALTDAADFVGQYGIYNGQRYTCTALPDTWTLDDAGQTAAQVVAAVSTYATKCLGLYAYASGFPAISGMHKDDILVAYEAEPFTNCGVYVYSTSWAKVTNPNATQIALATNSILDAVRQGYGTSSNYVGSSTSFEILLVNFLVALKAVFGAAGGSQVTIDPTSAEILAAYSSTNPLFRIFRGTSGSFDDGDVVIGNMDSPTDTAAAHRGLMYDKSAGAMRMLIDELRINSPGGTGGLSVARAVVENTTNNAQTNRHYTCNSATTIEDVGSDAQNGTNHGATAVTGKISGGLAVDGVSQYVELPGFSAVALTEFDIEFWVKLASTSDKIVIGNWQAGGAGSDQWLIVGNYSSANTITFYGADTSADYLEMPITWTTDWTHIRVVYETGAVSLWVDGVNTYNGIIKANKLRASSQAIWIGRYTTTYGKFQIDDVRINKTIISNDIAEQIYNAGGGTEENTVAVTHYDVLPDVSPKSRIAHVASVDGYVECAGVIRQAANGTWSFIDDTAHSYFGFSNIFGGEDDSGRAYVSLFWNFSVDKIITFVCTPDETYAMAGVSMGASVAKTYAMLNFGRNGTALSASALYGYGGSSANVWVYGKFKVK